MLSPTHRTPAPKSQGELIVAAPIASRISRRLRTSVLALFLTTGSLCAQPAPRLAEPDPPASAREPIILEELTVLTSEDDYDATGMGSFEEELQEAPFANDLIDVTDSLLTDTDQKVNTELAAIAEPAPADRIAGGDRLNLRGFPTPALRNGFIQVGMLETLNTAQTIVIQGPLIPVLGRAAPGGIQNYMTARPRTNEQLRFTATVSTRDWQRASLEYTSPLRAKKSWQRVAVEWQRRRGPEAFAREETQAAYTALTWKHSRKASTMLAVDFRQVEGRVSPGIPEYRVDATQRIAGPWLPMALFNANGPAAGVRRRSAAASLQFDGQPSKHLALRTSLEGWWRTLEQDRFTTSVHNLATGKFEGVREPRHLEQPQQALAFRFEGTLRFNAWGSDQKLLASASVTRAQYHREERSLTLAERNRLPPDVLTFNPFAPNYYLPDFSPESYQRILANRQERASYLSAEVSDRMAWKRGQLVATTGVRFDVVDMEVNDLRPGASRPRLSDRTHQASYHAGVNYQVLPSRLLAFASTSTAFDPSTPVDARTGRIQDNETTLGFEAGWRGRELAGRLEYTLAGFMLFNQHIARRNPLYNDPIADADQTQPQLVASGEEEFSGGRLELKWMPSKTFVVALKSVATRAITTASPDLPQEVGRPITRLPPLNLSAHLRHRPAGALAGFNWGASWQYIDGFVANYADARREELIYPGYGLASFTTGWQWRRNNRILELDLAVRNALDCDLTASHARVGTGREFNFSTRLIF